MSRELLPAVEAALEGKSFVGAVLRKIGAGNGRLVPMFPVVSGKPISALDREFSQTMSLRVFCTDSREHRAVFLAR